MTHRKYLLKAVSLFGSQAELARRLDVAPQRVSAWLRRDKGINPSMAVRIEQITKRVVKKEQLCPQVFK